MEPDTPPGGGSTHRSRIVVVVLILATPSAAKLQKSHVEVDQALVPPASMLHNDMKYNDIIIYKNTHHDVDLHNEVNDYVIDPDEQTLVDSLPRASTPFMTSTFACHACITPVQLHPVTRAFVPPSATVVQTERRMLTVPMVIGTGTRTTSLPTSSVFAVRFFTLPTDTVTGKRRLTLPSGLTSTTAPAFTIKTMTLPSKPGSWTTTTSTFTKSYMETQTRTLPTQTHTSTRTVTGAVTGTTTVSYFVTHTLSLMCPTATELV
eukprot:Hpha_TRINITY_DN15923_c0_g2::TRINITY_DN15923_c0_g2_i2::g.74279::m.74279